MTNGIYWVVFLVGDQGKRKFRAFPTYLDAAEFCDAALYQYDDGDTVWALEIEKRCY